MIKSKVEVKEVETKEIDFPIIMVSNLTGTVVLFTDNRTGTLLKRGVASERIGEHSTTWNPANEYWTPLTGKITLSNE